MVQLSGEQFATKGAATERLDDQANDREMPFMAQKAGRSGDSNAQVYQPAALTGLRYAVPSPRQQMLVVFDRGRDAQARAVAILEGPFMLPLW